MANVKTTTRTHMVIPEGGVRMLHKKFKKAGMFLNMTEILIVPEVAHDACGVVKYLVNAFSGLSGQDGFDGGFSCCME